MDNLSAREKAFNESKEAYVNQREDERTYIAHYLERQGFTVSFGSGRETSKEITDPTFDYSNWKWVQAIKGDKYYYISLQAFDRDPSSKNFHVLMDRIGVYVGEKVSDDCEINYLHHKERIFKEMKVTRIQLPVIEASASQSSIEKLLSCLENPDTCGDPGVFTQIKNNYEQSRAIERKTIVEYLERQGFSVVGRMDAGMGKSNYISGKNSIMCFDNTNWKWIEAAKGNKYYFISLQPFEKDPKSDNFHTLMDRIGVYVSKKDKPKIGDNYNADKIFNEMQITDLVLPMNSTSLSDLARYLDNLKA